MKQNRWDKIESILDTALTLTGDERTSYINEACSEDKGLLKEVYEILEAMKESERTRFLEGASRENKALFKDFSATANDLIGTSIGSFTVTEQIGTGGMGTVYKAKRTDGQFSQQVAIKLLQKSIQSEETLRRFRMEQEILASLKHPHIAQLYDGGLTDSGLPYLIMEYVDGVSIDRYCNDNKLSTEERIKLFKEVCSAVQFAHSNLVIHRDLKAQNIYVTSDGNVKILDFGIAKLLDPNLTEHTLLQTRPGQKFWTPQYAAPEQVSGQPVTTATDVYALGVLLHKLLTGTHPLDMKDEQIAAVERIITEKAPIYMSQSVQESELKKKLAGDLDALALKALRKEPEYRYNSVGQLLEDLDRYHNGLPLVARNDTVRYRMGKFFRRHKTGIVFTAIILLIISGLIGFYTLRIAQERNVAKMEAEKAEQVSNFMKDLFQGANPYGEEAETGLDTKIGTLLQVGSDRIDTDLQGQPEVKASLKKAIGEVYLRLGEFKKAEKLFNEAIIFAKEAASKTERASSMYQLANVYQETGKVKKADSLLYQSIQLFEFTDDGFANKEAIAALSLYGNLSWFNQGNFSKADSLLSKRLELSRQYFADNPIEQAAAFNDLATLFHAQGQFDKAESYYQKSIEMYEASAKNKASLAIVMGNFSNLLRENGKLDKAEDFQQKVLRIAMQKEDQFKIDIALGIGNLSNINLLKGNFSKADSLARISMNKLVAIYGPLHPYVARTKLILGKSYYQQKEYEKAKKLFLQVNNDYQKTYPENHPRLADPILELGKLYVTDQNLEKGITFLKEAYEIKIKSYDADNWRIAEVMSAYGNALSIAKKAQNADSLLIKSYSILKNEFGEDDGRTKLALRRLEDHDKRIKE